MTDGSGGKVFTSDEARGRVSVPTTLGPLGGCWVRSLDLFLSPRPLVSSSPRLLVSSMKLCIAFVAGGMAAALYRSHPHLYTGGTHHTVLGGRMPKENCS